MSEENEGVVVPSDEQPIPEALSEAGPEKLARIRAALEKMRKTTDAKTVSGSEAPADATGAVSEGKDVDWSEYDLPFNLRHLYPDAMFRETTDGPRWVVLVDEFRSLELSYGQHGVRDKNSEPRNLGEFLNDLLNGPGQWKLVSILPGSVGRVGVLVHHKVTIVLPDPVPLKKETEVEPPSDVELEKMEVAAKAFMDSEDPMPSMEAQALALNPGVPFDPDSHGLNAANSVEDAVSDAVNSPDFNASFFIPKVEDSGTPPEGL